MPTVVDLNISRIETADTQMFKKRVDALAVNISNHDILYARALIGQILSLKLDYFKGWSQFGESHITVITPPEMKVLNEHVSQTEINNIARRNKIQSSDINLLGIGNGKDKKSQTLFIILESKNLIKIRRIISELYIKRSKKLAIFNPNWFFPHITIGFTKTDLHEHNGVIKNMAKSYDKRFILK
jgi:2'-5' RNA ligase